MRALLFLLLIACDPVSFEVTCEEVTCDNADEISGNPGQTILCVWHCTNGVNDTSAWFFRSEICLGEPGEQGYCNETKPGCWELIEVSEDRYNQACED